MTTFDRPNTQLQQLCDLEIYVAAHIAAGCPALPPIEQFNADDPQLPEKIGEAFEQAFANNKKGYLPIVFRKEGIPKIEKNDYQGDHDMISDCLRGGYLLAIECRYTEAETGKQGNAVVRVIGNLAGIKQSIREGEWNGTTEAKPDVHLTKFGEDEILWSGFSKRAKRLIAPKVDDNPGGPSFSQCVKRYGGVPAAAEFSAHMIAYMVAHGYLISATSEVGDILKTVTGGTFHACQTVAEVESLVATTYGKKH